jgi:trans-2,3-dihydro-3-hydroxyanthranilate isomerase
MRLPFYTLDVFTDRTFGGNPLGVFPDATHLPVEAMQQIAREMNLSESVFLGPPQSGGTARVRIFTPGVEVPFAGHPTIGTAIFLASRLDLSPTEGSATLVLEENVGPVPVEVRFEGGEPVFAWLTTAVLPEHRPLPFTCGELAAMVGLAEDDVCGDLQPEVVSCGLPYSIIPVRSVQALRGAVLDMAAWKRMLADTDDHHVYLVCPAAGGEAVDVRVRMFAPGSGVPEDPATGSAAAALGGYLARSDGRADGVLSWVVEQGVEVGRPSMLYVEVERSSGRTTTVRVGGSAVFVSEGSMTVPE